MALEGSFDEGDENLMIPLSSIYEEMCCPICFNSIKECYMTPCGHNFCKLCLFECLNREHVCPCCRAPCVKKDARKNRQFDKLIEILKEEKEKSSKLYFENLVKGGGGAGGGGGGAGGGGGRGGGGAVVGGRGGKDEEAFSPVEQVFQKYMQKTMASYLTYYKQLEEKFEKQKTDLRDKLVVELTEKKMASEQNLRKLKGDGRLSAGEREKKIEEEKEAAIKLVADLSQKCTEQVSSLQEEFDLSTKLLVESYENYLETIDSSPKFLNLTVNVSLPAQNITLKSIVLKPTDTKKELKAKVEERMNLLKNPLHDYGANPIFTLYPLFGDDKGKGKEDESGIVLQDKLAIVLCSDPPPPQGSTIAITGSIVLESDKPKECFTQKPFKKGESVCSYYTCLTCKKMNWICETCVEVCHKGHETKPYIMDHKPNWACCYCVKMKKCTIVKRKK